MHADFFFPPRATAPLALRVNAALYASAAGMDLLPYFGALDTRYHYAGRPGSVERFGFSDVARMTRRASSNRASVLPRWGGDVLVIGECSRRAEVDLMVHLVDGIVRYGRSVHYVSVGDAEDAWMHSVAPLGDWGDAVSLGSVCTPDDAGSEVALRPNVALRVYEDAKALVTVLADQGASLDREGVLAAWEIACAKGIFARLSTALDFRTLITRTTYLPLSAVALAACARSSDARTSVSLQHSVVTCPASHVPIPAKRLLCFGETSRALLESMDEGFARAAARPPICRALLEAGSLVDPIPKVTAAIHHRTVVLVDQTSPWIDRYFGSNDAQRRALSDAAATIARGCPSAAHIVIRLHPQYDASASFRRLALAHPSILLRDGAAPLEADLAGASIAVGLFSTALPVAAAAGIPTLFLWEPGWYSTPDLAPFRQDHFVAPGALAARIEALMSSASEYERARQLARRSAAAYFHELKTCAFEPAFVERMLAPLAVT